MWNEFGKLHEMGGQQPKEMALYLISMRQILQKELTKTTDEILKIVKDNKKEVVE